MLEFSRRKADKQLAGLEKLCVGDVAQAAMLAKSLVPRSARALQKENRKKVYRQLKDGANTGADVLSKTSVAANKAAKQGAAYSKRAALQASDLAMTKGTEFASAASSSASLAAENIAKETDYLLKNPKDGFGSLAKSTRKKVKKTAGKTKKSLQNVKNMMEKNPLYIFEKVLSRLFRSALVVIILSPVILFLLGFGLWKLGVVVNGLEFMTFGVLMAVVLPLLWYFVKHRVMDQLSGPVKEAVMKEMKKAKKVAKKVVPKGAMLTASASMSKIKNNLGGTLGGTLGSTLGAVNVRNINLARSKFSKFPRFGAPLSRRPNDENV